MRVRIRRACASSLALLLVAWPSGGTAAPKRDERPIVVTRETQPLFVSATIGPDTLWIEIDGDAVRWGAMFVAPGDVRDAVVFRLPDGTLTPGSLVPEGSWVPLWDADGPTRLARGLEPAPPVVMLARR